ncbi:MAG: hypothetical protein M3261_05075 [Thermoproteota archaeon]|nr:hypothetical protein [Thermoproteota archaeon]
MTATIIQLHCRFFQRNQFSLKYLEKQRIRADNDNSTTDLSRMTQPATNSEGFGSDTIFNGNHDNKVGGTREAESPFNFEGGLSTNAEDQQPSLASRFSTTDFRSFLDSFANSIFIGTTAFGAFGTSIVNGVNVNGISLDKNQDQFADLLGRLSQSSSYNSIDKDYLGDEET